MTQVEGQNDSQNILEHRLNVIHCVKFVNRQKLNSHLWFFQGFCKGIQPKYCFIMDAGLQIDEKSLRLFFEAFEYDEKIGGLCGFMRARRALYYNEDKTRTDDFDERKVGSISQFFHFKVFDIVSAQIYEYSNAHISDKPLESLLTYIHILPGAYCAYRWEALSGDNETQMCSPPPPETNQSLNQRLNEGD